MFWPAEPHGLYSPRSHKESDTAEDFLFHQTLGRGKRRLFSRAIRGGLALLAPWLQTSRIYSSCFKPPLNGKLRLWAKSVSASFRGMERGSPAVLKSLSQTNSPPFHTLQSLENRTSRAACADLSPCGFWLRTDQGRNSEDGGEDWLTLAPFSLPGWWWLCSPIKGHQLSPRSPPSASPFSFS